MLAIDRSILLDCVRRLVGALARFCLRHALKVQEVEACFREEFMAAAKRVIEERGEEVSLSRLSVMTGLTRREVQRIKNSPLKADATPGLITKVIGHWQSDRRFVDKERAPRVLTFGSEESDFNKLVTQVSKDLNPAAVLFELERVKAVERTDAGLKLAVQIYRPRGDVETGFSVLKQDIEDLIGCVEENVFQRPDIGALHLRTVYDRVRPEAATELKSWLLKEGNALHARAREKLSQFDQDVNPDPSFTGKTVRVTLGAFGRVSAEEE